MEYFFIILAIVIVLLIFFSVIKFVILPMFHPKLSADETFGYLEDKNYMFIEIQGLNKDECKKNHFNKQKNFFLEIYTPSLRSEYKLIAYSKSENTYKLLWVEITIWLYLIKSFTRKEIESRRVIKYIEETESKIINEIQSNYKNRITVVTNKCPACNSKIKLKDNFCNSCGLSIK